MNGAELRVTTEYLGIDQRALARILGVTERTVRRWIAGVSPVPDGVSSEVEQIEAYTMQCVGELIDALREDSDAVILVYDEDAAMWAARPATKPYPARWWRMVVARASREVPAAAIDYAA